MELAIRGILGRRLSLLTLAVEFPLLGQVLSDFLERPERGSLSGHVVLLAVVLEHVPHILKRAGIVVLLRLFWIQ